MSRRSLFACLIAASVFALPCFATTFIVPDDTELVGKADGIVTGVVISSRPFETEDGYIYSEYEIAVDRVLKGPFQTKTRIHISSPGGALEDRMTYVASSAHFRIDDEVLLFLTRHRGGWTPTDMILGKFTAALTSRGYRVAVRDAEDIVGWDRDGKVHREKIRLEAEFLQFIEDTVAGRETDPKTYEVEAGDVLAAPTEPRRRQPITNIFPAEPTTYSVSFFDCSGTRIPGRWTTATMDAGVEFFKNSAQNASGLGDGGVSIIQNALDAWTDDCESQVNITYGGTSANLKANDGVNVVVFNDPNGDIAGSWTGSGVIATCFSNSFGTHTFDAETWVSFGDSDVVFQNGYAGTESTIEEAMTHEIGHGIGFRHSDKHYLKSCTVSGECSLSCSPETACVENEEECSNSAIMRASVVTGLNYTLQSWDQHAADALYPGTCIVVDPPTSVTATATSTTNVNVSWLESTGATSYNVYRSTDGLTYSLAGNTATTSFNDGGRTADTAYLYKVRAVNGGESADSNIDLATTTIFTDDPLVAGTTLISATHVTQLRTAVDAVRALAGIGAGTYTDPTLTATVTTAKAAHVNDLRTELDAARADLGLTALSYAETVTATVTTIDDSHFTELRNGVK